MLAPTGTALVVHDLKNELGALEGALATLSARPDRDGAAAAHRQCVRLRQRLVMFLTLYGGDGRLQAHCEDESPVEVLDAVRQRHDDPDAAVRVGHVSTGSEPPFWYLDRRLVELALDAAMHNALRFARSRVWLSAAQADEELVLAIEDDGPGPDPDPDPARAPEAHNTGLGTGLCAAVGRAHGSTQPDGGVRLLRRRAGGARFELRLPT